MGGMFDMLGKREPYGLIERSDTWLTLAAQTDSFVIRRTFTLSAERPSLCITTAVTNTSDKPREIRMRSHTEWDLGALATTRVRFTDRQCREVDQDMRRVIAELREGQYFRRDDTPDGSWTFTGSKGLAVTQRFDAAQVEAAWLCAYPEDLGEIEAEIAAKPVTAGSGETVAFVQDLDVVRAP